VAGAAVAAALVASAAAGAADADSDAALILPSNDDLVIAHTQYTSILGEIKERYQRSGRYNQFDTARKRYIEGAAQPGIRLGKLPSALDHSMLVAPPTKPKVP
jgi:hypothetical protein